MVCSYTSANASPCVLGLVINVLRARETSILFSLDSDETSK